MDITLTVNGMNLSDILSTYQVTQEITYKSVTTTLDNVEHAYPGAKRPIVEFSLFPMTDAESFKLYDALSDLIFEVSFTNTHSGRDETRQMRLNSDVESLFLLKSIDGKRRYKGGKIQLRGI